MYKYLLILIVLTMFCFGCAQATDNYVPIRAGISDSTFKKYIFDSVKFNNVTSLQVIDSASGYTIPKQENASILKVTSENNLFRIYVDDVLLARNLTGPIVISSKDNNPIEINGLKRKGKQAAYRGIIELVRSSKDISKFSIVNVLSLKNYLRGVVPNEMPVRFGLEPLKAQTVAARNYAVNNRVKAYEEFDLCDSVACQVYFGANTENPISDTAIEETNGVIALDNEDKPILALYSSTAGGYTESYKYAFSEPFTQVFPSKEIHYLTAVADSKDFDTYETDEKAAEFYNSAPESFDDQSPYYRWSKEWTVDELEKVLAKTLPSQSKTGFVAPSVEVGEDIGKLISIKALERGKSGKIIKLAITTDKAIYIVQKELVIRRCFQKNGISLPSGNFIINYIDKEIPTYKFNGGGFGHGVGLSQWGAGKMGTLGYSYIDILQHYYQGIKLTTIPVDVYCNNKHIDRKFYTTEKEAKIYIKNPDNIEKISILINEKNLIEKLKDDITVIDISKYIKNGENHLSFTLIDDYADYTKKVTVYTEVREAKYE